MADINKTIEIQFKVNNGPLQTFSGTVDEVTKKVEDLEKATSGIKDAKLTLIVDGAEKSVEDIKKLGDVTDETANKTKSLKQQYREAVAELGKFEQGTEAYEIAAARAGKLADRIEDNSKAIAANKSGLDTLIGGLQGAAGAFSAIEGAAGLFGKKSEDVQKALQKVQSALALIQGINAFKDSLPALTKIGDITLGLPKKLGELAASLLGMGTAGATAGAETAAGMEAATVATEGFAASLISTGIGALIVALGAAAAYFYSEYESASDKAQRKAKETADVLSEVATQMSNNMAADQAEIDRLMSLGFNPKEQFKKLQADNNENIKTITAQTEAAYAEYLRLFDEYNKETDEKDKAEKQKKAEAQYSSYTKLNADLKSSEAKRYQISFAAGQAEIDLLTKDIRRRIALREAEGKSTIALQIELQNKILQINSQQTDVNYKLEEETQNKLKELRVKQIEEQKQRYQTSLNANKSYISAKLALDLATIENEKAAALSTAKTDEQKLKVETDAYAKSKAARIQALKDQLTVDLELAKSQKKTAKDIEAIKLNNAAAIKAIETEQINNTVKNAETEFKIKQDGLNEELRILQEKAKLEDASIQDRIDAQAKQNIIELETLKKQGKAVEDVIKRQAEDLAKLAKDLAKKKLIEDQTTSGIKKDIENSNAIINLKRKEGETLAQFEKRRTELEKQQNKLRLDDANLDLQAQLDQEVTYVEDGVEKKRKVIEAGSKEEAAIKKQIALNNKSLNDQELADEIAKENKKKDIRNKSYQQAKQLATSLADLASALLDIETKKIEKEYSKRTDALKKQTDKQLNNLELSDAQRLEIQREGDIKTAQLEEEKANKLKEIQKKQADIQLAVTIAQIAASTAEAIIKTIAELGGVGAITPPGVALLALIGATGAVQAGVAIAQRQAIQGLAKGGMVYGAGTETSDSIPAYLSNGEAVINAKAVKRFAPILSAINQSTGGAPIKPRFAAGGVVPANPGEVSVTNIQDIAAITGQNAVRAYILQSDVTSSSVRNQRILRNSRIK